MIKDRKLFKYGKPYTHMSVQKKIAPDQFKQTCASIGGKVYQEDDRLVCEANINNMSLKIYNYPDGSVSFTLPNTVEKVLKKFYV